MVKFIKASFTWFCRRTWIASNPALDLQFRRVHAKETQPFQTDELLALLSVQPTSSAGYRDLSMWFLFADTGLRCQELCQLRREDLSGNELVIRNGKGGKRRSVSLGSATMKLIQVYLDSYRPLGEVYIFLTDEGREMKPRHVAKRLELWAKKANVKNATPHRFRATFATQFVLKEGNDLIKLQALLGHTTLDMSRRYVKLAMEEEARLTNSACSVVDQLIAREQAEPAIRKDSPDGSNPPTPLSHMSPMGFQLNSPEAAMWMSMFQIVAGMMNAMFQAQSPGIQVPAAPVGISGGPFALPNAKLHEG
jgi:site-specific recombinase XerD